jgi:hypothetical protein
MKKTDFDDKWMPEPNSGCWLWTASLRNDGYGQVRHQGDMDGAHRVSWRIHIGEIPKGMQVLHRCDTPTCVNPDHLFIGTHGDNMKDAANKMRFRQSGESNGYARLTELDVEAIRGASGLQREIASRFKVSQSTVSLIKLGKRWRQCVPVELREMREKQTK